MAKDTMERITGTTGNGSLTCANLAEQAAAGGVVRVHGMVHTCRHMGDIRFVILRLRDGLLQCVLDAQSELTGAPDVRDEYSVSGEGRLIADERAPGGFELHLDRLEVIARPFSPRPVHLGKRSSQMSLEANLTLRPITLRHQRQRAVFRLQEGLCRGFRDFLHQQGFTEIHTPKIVSAGAEGGSNIFRLDYFGSKAFLAQSPQFYKQMMVGVFERVCEVGPVFRAEKHSTARHLNEYTSMDFEMGFIQSFHDIMNMEAAMLQYTMRLLATEYAREVAQLQITLPDASAIPMVTFTDAKNRVAEKYQRHIRDPYDLEPEEERLIGELFKEEYGSDFVFVTHYPSKKRPFYAMDDPADPRFTLSFDLLLRGTEITTGGQRIHSYEDQVAKMQARGMDPDSFASYLMIHQYGMPPHGGLGIGLERLLQMLTGDNNIRHAVLFPRDLTRLDP
jgi:nondiscriminating aspartyl-tRNA synthetase